MVFELFLWNPLSRIKAAKRISIDAFMAQSSKFRREGTVSPIMCYDWFKRVVTAILLVVMSPGVSHKLEACKNVKLDWDGALCNRSLYCFPDNLLMFVYFLQVMSRYSAEMMKIAR